MWLCFWVGMVVFLRFVGGVVVFCGGVVVSLRLCFCGGCSCVFVVAFLRFVGGVVVFCGCFCDCVFVVVLFWREALEEESCRQVRGFEESVVEECCRDMLEKRKKC